MLKTLKNKANNLYNQIENQRDELSRNMRNYSNAPLNAEDELRYRYYFSYSVMLLYRKKVLIFIIKELYIYLVWWIPKLLRRRKC